MSTLYEKIGRRYVPVHDTAACDGLPEGTWIVRVKGGSRHRLKAVDVPAAMETLAVVPELVEWLTEELREWSKCRPSRPLTAKERRAWKAYTDIMGEDADLTLVRPAAWDVASKVAKKIAERAAKGGQP